MQTTNTTEPLPGTPLGGDIVTETVEANWSKTFTSVLPCGSENGPSLFISFMQGLFEGDGDVVGVVTPLRGVAQVVLHGIQVVEVGVRLRVYQDGEMEEDGEGQVEDGEGQVEVEREEGEVKERRSCMKMG